MKDGSQRERRESLDRINESECLQKIEEWRDEGRSGGVEESRCRLDFLSVRQNYSNYNIVSVKTISSRVSGL